MGALATELAAVLSGGLVGLVLGLVGGGGSILAVPLLVYVVGVTQTHVAIGTSAIAVAASAFSGLVGHARAGTVKWRCAVVFTGAGIAGVLAGAEAAKATDGQVLLGAFGGLMIVVGIVMLLRRNVEGDPDVRLSRDTARTLMPPLLGIGFGVGLLSGFFGIGGGFLIVPGLMLATGMPIRNAIGTSLAGVTMFGLTTAGSYAVSGFVDWWLAAFFIGGGLLGGLAGIALGQRLANIRGALNTIFAGGVILVGIYILARTVTG